MSQSWIRGPVCGVDNCTSRLYRTVDGLKICQYGHVMDGNIEINDDQDDNFVQTKRLNINLTGLGGDFLESQRAAGLTSRKGEDKNKKLYGLAAKELYLQCVQAVLEGQLNIVIQLFFANIDEYNIEEELTPTVKLYWLKTLTSCLSGNDESNDIDLSDPNVHLPTTIDLICIIYLSLVKLKFPVYLQDILSSIRQNRIPYMKCIHLVPKTLLAKLPSTYINLLEPKKLPCEDDLFENIHIIGKRIGFQQIELSVNYYFPLVFKIFSKMLLLPNAPEMFILWISITEILGIFSSSEYLLGLKIVENEPKILSKPKRLWRRKGIPKATLIEFPELRILSLIIFTVKFYFVYKLKTTFDCKIWLQNLGQYELDHEFPISQTNNVEEDIINWSDHKINRYCQWAYENLIPKKNKTFNIESNDPMGMIETEELNMMDKRLFQIFNIDQQEYVSSGKRKLDVETNGEVNDIFGGYNETKYHVSVGDVNDIENHLIEKFCNEFGVTKGVLEACYGELEGQIKQNLKLK